MENIYNMDIVISEIKADEYSIIIELKNVIDDLSIIKKYSVCNFLHNFTSIKQK